MAGTEPISPEPLHGKSILVTGGGRGFGRSLAIAAAEAGASVFLVGTDENRLARIAHHLSERDLSVDFATADVTDPHRLHAAADRAAAVFGGIDVLVNNAAISGPVGPTWELDVDAWWRAIEVNLRGSELAVRAVMPHLIARGGGRIVNIVSQAGKKNWPYASAYSVSKAALIKLTENLSVECRKHSVVVLSYDPGLLDIGMTKEALNSDEVDDPFREQIRQWILRSYADGAFTPLDAAVGKFLRMLCGAYDHRSGEYLTIDGEPVEERAHPQPGGRG